MEWKPLNLLAPCHRYTVVGNPGGGGGVGDVLGVFASYLILFRGVLEVVRKSTGVGSTFMPLLCFIAFLFDNFWYKCHQHNELLLEIS
jgi:hypothetical protein